MNLIWFAVIAGIIGLVFVIFLAVNVLKKDAGSERIREITTAIEEGSKAFLRREYITLVVFVIIVFIVLSVIPDIGWKTGVAYLLGAVTSGGAGYIGMRMGVKANGRTATAAQNGLNPALRIAFSSGAVMGTTVVALGILGLSIIYLIFGGSDIVNIIVGFSFGASSIALFSRVGGGIFTKGADVGSDLVGKVEAGIPEDDPRNPGVIADNVGDNVGDIAGMGADLFESYAASIVATLVVAVAAGFAWDSDMAVLPFIIAAGGILSGIIGTFFVRTGEKAEMNSLLWALRRGIYIASVLVVVVSGIVIWQMDGVEFNVFWAVVSGLVAGILIGLSVEYYTSYTYRPTQAIAESAETGTGTLIIKGFGTAMMSTLIPVLLVVIATVVSYKVADLYGIAIAALGMLSTLGITLATDAYGPVADNAGGIAEQAHLDPEVRERTDALDSLGNTTAATGKGFAIGSAALAALGMTAAFGETMRVQGINIDISLRDPIVIVGLFIGAMMVFIFSALTMEAVGKAAMGIVNEVRRQWREIKGLMEGTAKPDYAKCVSISTGTALKAMILPGLLAVISPILVGLLLGANALGGMLIGAISAGFMMAVTMANAGGAWDNAKKWIETGKLGGKGSDAHKAAVVGDTVGDPFKDTSGPSLNILLKLMSIVAVVFAPIFTLTGWLG
ncbi:MAG: sodium-translocating pyrophosphatase [Dehalococcoidales bacterium]|nr:sodium-translocating pyrophosphatase [Dehalococcoidales bacterium]